MRTHLPSVPQPESNSMSFADAESRDEAGIICSVLAGHTDAFHELIRPYEGLVYQLAFLILRNQADAEDAAQDAFLNAYRNLARFRFESKFSIWLCSIAINAARTSLRQQNRRVPLPCEEVLSETHIDKTFPANHRPAAFDMVEFHELRELLHNAVAKLPAIYRELMALRIVEEQSVSAIAEEIQSSNDVVKVRLYRARHMLRSHLVRYLTQSAMHRLAQ